jgi:flagellar hook assembly protein FlgD
MEPTDLGLVQAFPNPMRVRTEIRLRLTAGEHVTLDVVDLAGRRIRSLADDQWLDAGVHAYGWDGRDVSGSRAPGGVYLIAVRAGNRFAVRKLALID